MIHSFEDLFNFTSIAFYHFVSIENVTLFGWMETFRFNQPLFDPAYCTSKSTYDAEKSYVLLYTEAILFYNLAYTQNIYHLKSALIQLTS